MPQELTTDEQDVINRYRSIKRETAAKKAKGEIRLEVEFGRLAFVVTAVNEKAVLL